MPKDKVTLYFWYRESTIDYISRIAKYGYSAVNYRITMGLFSLSKGYLVSQERVNNAFAEVPPVPSAPCVGHVSLKTHRGGENGSGIYASFWPKKHHSTPFNKIGIEGSLVHSLEDDKKLEYLEASVNNNVNNSVQKKEHDHFIELNNLDVDVINQAFLEFKRNINNSNWSLWGSAAFRKAQTQNCAGLVEYLLTKGGFYDRIKQNYQLDYYNRISCRISSLTSASVSGVIWGAILNGKRGAYIYGPTFLIYTLILLKLLAGPGIDTRQATADGLESAAFGIVPGMMPILYWSTIKGVKVGYRIGMEKSGENILMGVASAFSGSLAGNVLVTLPINAVMSAIAGCLSEGTGLVLTPAGVLQLAEYAKQSESSKKPIASPIFPSVGIDSNTINEIKKLVGFSILMISAVYILSNEIDNTLTITNPFRLR